jgi:transcriptional regulator with XRE-family HTH domain
VAEGWLVDEAPGPEEVRLARELHDEVIQAIKLLSIPNQEAVIGYYLQGCSQAELAELLGVPVGTIKARLHKSRKQLGPTLEPVARQVLGTVEKEKETMSEEQMVEVAVEDALKMPSDDERGLEMLRTGGSLIEVERVAVIRLAEGTFYGEINLRRKDGEEALERRVDSRPSDAIALAVRLGTPIYVAQSVLDEAAFEFKVALLEARREGQRPFAK